MLYLHHTCLCINRLKSKLYTFCNKMAFLYFLLICELLVYKTISRFQGPPFPFRNYSARTVHAQPEPSISPEQHSALEKWAFAQTAPRLSIHFREMHHRQNRTYFGGPRLQAVGITSNEKSHFLGWEKKFPFSNKSLRRKIFSKILSGFSLKIINQSSKYTSMQLVRLEFHTEFDYSFSCVRVVFSVAVS